MPLVGLKKECNKLPDIVVVISTTLFFPKNFTLKEEKGFLSLPQNSVLLHPSITALL